MAKKGLIYRLTMGKDNLPDFTQDKLPGTRWEVFKDVFRQRFWTLARLNFMTILFFLPAIAWMVWMYIYGGAIGGNLPYSSNLGLGYPVVDDAVMMGNALKLILDIQTYAILIPLLMIGSIGLAGAFHVMKLLVWGEGISLMNNFFKGIKSNIKPFLFTSALIGIMLLVIMTNINMSKLPYENKTMEVLSVIAMVISIMVLVLLVFVTLFMLTQTVTYKLKLRSLIKNSFLFSIALLPQNIFFVVVSLLPALLFFFSFTVPMGLIFYLFVGFSFTILVWTIYAHHIFDKFVNDKVAGAIKDKGIYRRTEDRKKEMEERRKKSANIRFANPKKKKPVTSVEEGSTFTPLAASFSRKDLERLAEEKAVVKKEIDDEYAELENDVEAQEAEGAELEESGVEAVDAAHEPDELDIPEEAPQPETKEQPKAPQQKKKK